MVKKGQLVDGRMCDIFVKIIVQNQQLTACVAERILYL